MRPFVLPAVCLLAGAQAGPAPAAAQSLPVGETTYVERSLNRSDTLIVEHPPVRANPLGRDRGSAAIAGFCREGGLIRRLDASGQPVLVRQREVCDSVAPRTLSPGAVDPRPAWPAETRSVLRVKG